MLEKLINEIEETDFLVESLKIKLKLTRKKPGARKSKILALNYQIDLLMRSNVERRMKIEELKYKYFIENTDMLRPPEKEIE